MANDKLILDLRIRGQEPGPYAVDVLCVNMPERLRGKGFLARVGGFRLTSAFAPDWVEVNDLLLPGENREHDIAIASCGFKTVTEARSACDKIREAVALVNKADVDGLPAPDPGWERVQ